tara:strand:- start:187 stop:807 length:621 start_codon:yes stop_codon:yes gene_type:complete
MTNSDNKKNEEVLGHELSEKEIEEAIEEGKKVALDEDLLDDSILEETNLDLLAEEVTDLKDKLIRSLADKENLRKRAEKERREAEIYGGTKLARDLLSVYDNMGRALENIDENLKEQAKPLIEGIELTQRELISVFKKHKIEKIEPEIGEKFDPKWHQAMFESPIPDTKKGEIIQIMVNGFRVSDRLLRAAQVGVSSFEGDEGENN